MTESRTYEPAQRFLGLAAAVLMLVGLLTGGLVAQAMVGKVPADPHAMLASHLNAMLGAFWMLSVAFTLPMLRYGDVGRQRLAWVVTIPNYANWIVTMVKAFLHVSGVDYTGHAANDAIFFILDLTVVAPSLLASGAWVYGFLRKPSR